MSDPIAAPEHPITAETRDALIRRGVSLEYTTLGWNVVGSVIVIVAALVARSVALAGFGLDSLIEIVASVIVVWELTGAGGQERERSALRLIGIAFLCLALYILAQSTYTLLSRSHPHTSVLGIIWLAATLIAMLLLSWGKRMTGERIGNPVLMTEAHVTLIDALLAAAVLAGLILNAAFGWWFADPLAGLVIVYYGVREGLTALRHEG
jgi:divalent metal cation (Fe/Co/Zn/Cd) transporter